MRSWRRARALLLLVLAWVLASAPPALAQGLSGFVSPGPLAEPHANLDGLTQCTRCHAAGEGVSAAKCLDCHDEIAAQVAAGHGFHADKGDRCQRCHLDHRGRGYDMVRLDADTFDHASTGFPLRGGHAGVECVECHRGEAWTGLDPACTSCHDDPHGADASRRALAEGCTHCHSDQRWTALPLPLPIFDHDQPTHAAWALEGAHSSAPCEGCHPAWRFLPTAHDGCTTCHQDPHRAPLSDDCATCHAVRADWRVDRFDHALTGYRLEGVHQAVACRSCHPSGVLRRVPHGTCADCHEDPHDGQFAPRTCDECHSQTRPGWALADFDHAAVGWPLEGRHADATCASCHGEGPEATYAAVSRECATCHDDAHGGRFAPSGCDECHTAADWDVAAFDHGRTAWPLTGAHQRVACEVCHARGLTGLAHETCADCHADRPHDGTVPAASCAGCHDTAVWSPVAFDHATTAFALPPQHGALACESCHGPARFVGLEAACASCHEPDRPPAHFDGDCGGCHRAAGWAPADLGPLGHDATGFPLVASHARVDCVACHPADRPRGATPTDCAGCHATDDPHRNLLGEACGDCHTESVWVRTRWRHQLSGWPLQGAHRLAACEDCHAAGYAGTPTDCRTCHLDEVPPGVRAHASAFFDACETCHLPFTWAAPRYRH